MGMKFLLYNLILDINVIEGLSSGAVAQWGIRPLIKAFLHIVSPHNQGRNEGTR